MHLIPFKGRNISSTYILNLLFQNGKTFIMDNHLAASWCWLQKIDATKSYNFLHIDRHYDLLDGQIDWWLEVIRDQNVDFKKTSIDALLKIEYHKIGMPTNESIPLLRWDNYITIFNRLYPNIFASSIFATHKDGTVPDGFRFSEKEIIELHENLSYYINSNGTKKWIVNLDIDYFFTGSDEGFQFLTDEYIMKIAQEIKKAWDNIEVITIALSPECCGGWDNSVRVAKLITEYLDVDWEE